MTKFLTYIFVSLFTFTSSVNAGYFIETETVFGLSTSVGMSTDKGETSLHPNGETSLTLKDTGHDREQITRATIGRGNITVGGESNLDLEGLNRDVSVSQEITKDKITGALDGSMTIDNRVFSGEGWRSIIEDHTNLVGNTIKIWDNLGMALNNVKEMMNFNSKDVNKDEKEIFLNKILKDQDISEEKLKELDKELQKYKQYGFAKELVESGAIGRLVLEGVMFLLGYENVDLNPDGTHKVYDDGTGVLTIGYGHVITKMDRETNRFTEKELSHGITEDKARDIFISDLKSPIQSAVNINKTVSEKFSSPLTDKQFSAIVSLVFNIGGGNWADSEAFRELRNSGQVSYDTWLKNVRNRKGEYMPGLENRRTAEYEIYKGGNYEIKQLSNR